MIDIFWFECNNTFKFQSELCKKFKCSCVAFRYLFYCFNKNMISQSRHFYREWWRD